MPTFKTALSMFTKEMPDAYAEGVAATFALVACADATLDPLEPLTLSQFLKDSPALNDLQQERVEVAFRKFAAMLMENYKANKGQVLYVVSSMCSENIGQSAAIEVARTAIVADGKIRQQEEMILEELSSAIGVDVRKI